MRHSVNYSLTKASNKLKKGKINEAEKIFQSVLSSFPGNSDALRGLKLCAEMKPEQLNLEHERNEIISAYRDGNHEEVIKLSAFYLSHSKNDANILLHRGASFGILKEMEKAQKCFETVMEIAPKDPAPWNNFGTLMKMQDQPGEAIQYFQQALERDPNHFDALKNIGYCYEIISDDEKAISYFNKAIAAKESPELLNHLGSIYARQGDDENAQDRFLKCLDLDPHYIAALNNLGNLHLNKQRYEKAISLYEQAIEISPTYGDAYNNLANALKDMGYLDEAIYNYKKAIEFHPTKSELYSNYSVVLKDKLLLDEAMDAINTSIELKPDFHDAYWNRSLIKLSKGDFEGGWVDYEWRWRATNFDSTYLETSKPEWNGKKEKVLIWPEQGIGDQIMFSHFFEDFAALCALPIFQVDDRLIPIFRRSMPQFHFIPSHKKLAENEYDSHLPMGSMGRYVRSSMDQFHNAMPTLLKADMQTSEKLKQAFRLGDKQLIGLSWKSKNKATGLMRSLSLTDLLTPLIGKGFEFVNLQYGDNRDEIMEAYKATGIDVKSVNEIDTFENIDHLASLIQCCDKVITIDNSTVHLAGAMGKKTNLLLPYITDWRWLGGTQKPVWYDEVEIHKAPYGVSLKDAAPRLLHQIFQN